MTYAEYLKTDHWQLRRKMALDLYERRCAMCQSTTYLEVHHVHYKRDGKSILFNEQPNDLIVLCDSCHELWHRAQHMDPKRLEEITEKMLGGKHLEWRASVNRYKPPRWRPLPPLPSTRKMHLWTPQQHAQYQHIKELRKQIILENRNGK